MSNITFKIAVEKMGGNDPASHVGVTGDLFYDPDTGAIKKSDGTTPGGIAASVVGSGISNIVKLTQAEYDELDPPDESTLYVIVG